MTVSPPAAAAAPLIDRYSIEKTHSVFDRKKNSHCLGLIIPSPYLSVALVLSPLLPTAKFDNVILFSKGVESHSKKYWKPLFEVHVDKKFLGKIGF